MIISLILFILVKMFISIYICNKENDGQNLILISIIDEDDNDDDNDDDDDDDDVDDTIFYWYSTSL